MSDQPAVFNRTHDAGEAEGSLSASPRDLRASVTNTGLSIVYQPVGLEPILDIVFVHGLQGHPFKTWAVDHQTYHEGKIPSTGKAKGGPGPERLLGRLFTLTRARKEHSSVFWPADLLPTEFPTARILVFGYDTVVAKHQFAGAVNKNSVFAHSKDVVNELSRARPLGRPIVFVTHSLGGIVVKESLALCAMSNIENDKDILKSTTGVMFLGTPHRGSNAAGVGEIARKAASLLLMDTNSRVLDSLALRNSDLERCQDAFSSLWLKYNFHVKTFQEGLPLKLPIRLRQSKMLKVVPDISSCLGDSRERAETLDGDHRSMCRYTGAEDQNYKKVAAELHAMCTNLFSKPFATRADRRLPGNNMTDDNREKLEYFKFTGALFRQLAISAPAENTCQWLPRTPCFEIWIERRSIDSHRGLLQLVGKPGTGKSTLMKQIFEATRVRFHHDPSVCVISHFFDRGGQLLQHSSLGLLRSLLYQLGTQHSASLAVFRDYTKADLQLPSNSRSALVILKSGLERIFSDSSFAPQRTIIFVDALDECDPDDFSSLGYFLAGLASKANNHGIQLDICMSRREYPSITVRHSLEIRLETYNGADIRQYMEQKLEFANIPAKDQDVMVDTIYHKSNGIFLWVVLAVEGILKDIEAGENTRYILNRTESLPKTLETLYSQIIREMNPENRKMALRLFQWAVLATERLRVGEWHHILAFIREKAPASLKEWKDSDYYTETDTQLERRIRTLSQGLVEVKGTGDSSTAMSDAASDSGSLRAGAGSLDSTWGDSRIVQPIHETVTEFFTSGGANSLFMEISGSDFAGGGHIFIASTCLAYTLISELDGLIHARQRIGTSSVSVLHEKNTRGRANKGEVGLKRSHRRRSRSATSFMSSASSHSGKHHLQNEETSSSSSIHDIEDELPAYHPSTGSQYLEPATPEVFADLFPTLHPLTIRHDDSTLDGNMNLVVETSLPEKPDQHTQLFHFRMYHLSSRKFSVRRYCRGSQNEVGQSRRKYVKVDTDPISRMFKSIREWTNDHEIKPDVVDARRSLAAHGGYTPWVSLDNNIGEIKDLKPTDVIRLEFTNYSTIELQYLLSPIGQTYKFSYWETEYYWNRVEDHNVVSFHLSKGRDSTAFMTPLARSHGEDKVHALAGAWVPPYHIRLDESFDLNNAQLADVIISTGLTVLADEYIKKLEISKQKEQRENQRKSPNKLWPRPVYQSPPSDPAESFGSSVGNNSLSWSFSSYPFEAQTLEAYPALTSYVLNRVFVHAKKGLVLGACPDEFLSQLVVKNAWKRWYTLQESVSGLRTWLDVLNFHDLEPWIDVVERMTLGNNKDDQPVG
ncbi:hypothetical protein F4808DRAFT_432407 [Astrocystis sublimbata]|nr:hypothetical protein F4808DRAFT_432407 [Astrocystis sublimbata]